MVKLTNLLSFIFVILQFTKAQFLEEWAFNHPLNNTVISDKKKLSSNTHPIVLD